MSDPPVKAIVKTPRSLTEISESCAIYSAKSVASSSKLSKIRDSLLFLRSPDAAIFPDPYSPIKQQALHK